MTRILNSDQELKADTGSLVVEGLSEGPQGTIDVFLGYVMGTRTHCTSVGVNVVSSDLYQAFPRFFIDLTIYEVIPHGRRFLHVARV